MVKPTLSEAVFGLGLYGIPGPPSKLSVPVLAGKDGIGPCHLEGTRRVSVLDVHAKRSPSRYDKGLLRLPFAALPRIQGIPVRFDPTPHAPNVTVEGSGQTNGLNCQSWFARAGILRFVASVRW